MFMRARARVILKSKPCVKTRNGMTESGAGCVRKWTRVTKRFEMKARK